MYIYAFASVYLCIASVYLRIASVYLRIRKCIFMHSQVYIYAFASVYLRIRKCIFTPQVYLYTTGVNLHLFGVNIEVKQFTLKKCIFTPVVYIYTGECVTILYTFFGVSTEAGIYTFLVFPQHSEI